MCSDSAWRSSAHDRAHPYRGAASRAFNHHSSYLGHLASDSC
jgi:hypothetical protein